MIIRRRRRKKLMAHEPMHLLSFCVIGSNSARQYQVRSQATFTNKRHPSHVMTSSSAKQLFAKKQRKSQALSHCMTPSALKTRTLSITWCDIGKHVSSGDGCWLPTSKEKMASEDALKMVSYVDGMDCQGKLIIGKLNLRTGIGWRAFLQFFGLLVHMIS